MISVEPHQILGERLNLSELQFRHSQGTMALCLRVLPEVRHPSAAYKAKKFAGHMWGARVLKWKRDDS